MSPFADFPPCRRSLTLGNRRRGTEEAQLKTRERIAVSPGFCAPTKTGLHPNCRLEVDDPQRLTVEFAIANFL
jgi:hypothetical protein